MSYRNIIEGLLTVLQLKQKYFGYIHFVKVSSFFQLSGQKWINLSAAHQRRWCGSNEDGDYLRNTRTWPLLTYYHQKLKIKIKIPQEKAWVGLSSRELKYMFRSLEGFAIKKGFGASSGDLSEGRIWILIFVNDPWLSAQGHFLFKQRSTYCQLGAKKQFIQRI